jgi:NAD(P)-dependent dehydrogenase (short-subunit alcohol dehydrogenase family)
VRVVRVLPGFIATSGAITGRQRLVDNQGIRLEQRQGSIAAQLNAPMNRSGTPEDFAELVAFLLSDRASRLTGAQYRVDGGILVPI